MNEMSTVLDSKIWRKLPDLFLEREILPFIQPKEKKIIFCSYMQRTHTWPDNFREEKIQDGFRKEEVIFWFPNPMDIRCFFWIMRDIFDFLIEISATGMKTDMAWRKNESERGSDFYKFRFMFNAINPSQTCYFRIYLHINQNNRRHHWDVVFHHNPAVIDRDRLSCISDEIKFTKPTIIRKPRNSEEAARWLAISHYIDFLTKFEFFLRYRLDDDQFQWKKK